MNTSFVVEWASGKVAVASIPVLLSCHWEWWFGV